MDPFVRRLIQRLTDPSQPLSRNRHFHVFDNAEGRVALRTSRRLLALRRDILACLSEGRTARYFRRAAKEDTFVVELRLDRLRGSRVSTLGRAEFELLTELPGVREALEEAA